MQGGIMREWGLMTLSTLGTWIIAAISINDVTLICACVASVATAITALVSGVSRIFQNRYLRQAAKYKAIAESEQMCNECLKRDKPFYDCGVNKKYCRRII